MRQHALCVCVYLCVIGSANGGDDGLSLTKKAGHGLSPHAFPLCSLYTGMLNFLPAYMAAHNITSLAGLQQHHSKSDPNIRLCPPGSMCTVLGGHGSQIGNLKRGVCLPCSYGESFCPRGLTSAYELQWLICPEGHVCGNSTSIRSCPEKFRCPAGTTEKLLRVDAMRDCSSPDLGGALGQYCASGTGAHPGNCPAGFYCPTPTMKEICPENYYCPKGSSRPRKCLYAPSFQSCPVGSTDPGFRGYSAFMCCVLLILVCLVQAVGYTLVSQTRAKSGLGKGISLAVSMGMHLCIDAPMPICHTDETETDAGGSAADTLSIDVADGEGEDKTTGFLAKHYRMSFAYENLGLSVPTPGQAQEEKSVLGGVSGTVEHSTLCAVMGPSGAGKTSFMNVLCGRAFYGRISGHVQVQFESQLEVDDLTAASTAAERAERAAAEAERESSRLHFHSNRMSPPSHGGSRKRTKSRTQSFDLHRDLTASYNEQRTPPKVPSRVL